MQVKICMKMFMSFNETSAKIMMCNFYYTEKRLKIIDNDNVVKHSKLQQFKVCSEQEHQLMTYLFPCLSISDEWKRSN